ncbi:MAG: hypothetical protein CMP51_01570 [Flavobacteriales bacterium]|nr:hypothetical protein [Flavobacteriales bacterium]
MNKMYKILMYRYLIFPFVTVIRHFSKSGSNVDQPHFFIFGSGRNGSTLLATILNAHKNIYIPPEEFVLPYAIIRRYFFFFWSSNKWMTDVLRLFHNPSKTIKWSTDFNSNQLNKKDIPLLFSSIFTNQMKKNKPEAIIWGDKSPLNTNFVKYIYPEFKQAKYIFLIRDPRDVALSYRKYLGNKAFTFGIWKWKDSVRTYKYLCKRTNVLLIKYEELVSNPQEQSRRISEFLCVPHIVDLANDKVSAEKMGVEADSHHKNLRKPISTRSVGKWKSELSGSDLKQFNKVQSFMKYFDYK